MRCPKCDHAQDDETRCERCGIYFAKYAQHLHQRQQRMDAQDSAAKPISTPLIALLVVLLALGGWLIARRAPVAPQPSAAEKNVPAAATAAESGLLDLAAQLAEANPARNEIEKVRNATVLVKTAWGSGSGFFVDRDCRILTNKHVVQIGDGTMSRVEDDLVQLRQAIEDMRARVEERKKRFYERCTRCDEQALQAHMGNMEQQLAAAEEQMQKRANLLTDVRLSGPRVVLADGSEHAVSLERTSTTSDLALLKLPGAVCPTVSFGDDARLAHGETLYTVGNPIGLKLTVTSGIFSGHYRDDKIHLLQTDAPINPGNSGGPLFDKQGRVIGINTMVAARTQGIGFAIPISAAIAEFGL